MGSSENEVYSSLGGISTYLDEVPFKISQKFQIVASEELIPVSPPPCLHVPDSSEILMQTQYDFTLEKKILEWLQDCSRKEPPRLVPTCPPFWLAFSDLERDDTDDMSNDSYHTKVQKDHMVLQTKRFRSFSVTDIKYVRSKVVYKSDSESDDGYSEDDELSSSDENEKQKLPSVPLLRSKFNLHSRFLDGRPASSPFCSDSPSRRRHCERCLSASLTRLPHISSHRSSPLCNNNDGEEEVKRHGSNWSLGHTPRKPCRKFFCQHQNNRNSKNLNSEQIMIGSPPLSSARCHLERSFMIRARTPLRKHKPPFPALSNHSCLPAPPSTPRPLNSHKTLPDSTADLLFALSQKEQDLIQPLMREGYPISRVIWAIQNVGQQSKQQILKYLSAWDRLCKEGYKERLVEEAMEIFQNSEEKAAEFLTLMAQFDEMGFQHEDIKEALLIHNNHREKALEELMIRSR
ncbi:ubiquitin-associated protein 1-like [Heterodontus francisci]|uniref:ubiquitin-associated protein 1-like n=1 Tax=Heterodontus francisci TaxID=7792 RepID=UPI00355BCBAE